MQNMILIVENIFEEIAITVTDRFSASVALHVALYKYECYY